MGAEVQEAFICEPSVREEREKQPRAKWRTTVAVSTGVATLVLVVNIAVLAWVRASFNASGDVAVVYDGDCKTSDRILALVDLAINILSSLLLGASNYTSQVLCAPSRNDLDREHSRGRWLDVGVASIRNLRRLPMWHTAIFLFLVLSTVPLHLFYNSVVFTSRSAVDYNAALVTTDFLTGAPWYGGGNFTLLSDLKPQSDLLNYMRQSAREWTRIGPEQCLFTFGNDILERDWLNVLAVSSLSTQNVSFDDGNKNISSSVLGIWQHRATVNDVTWPCDGNIHFDDGSLYSICMPKQMLASDGGWEIPYDVQSSCGGGQSLGSGYGQLYTEGCGAAKRTTVLYCLAEPFPQQCSLNVSISILAVVSGCNLVKILCLLATLYICKLQPVVNLGDAIASYLQNPDGATEGLGALEVAIVSSGVWRNLDDLVSTPWFKQRRRWWYAVPRLQLNITFFLCFVGWMLALIALVLGAIGTSGRPFSSFGALDLQNLVWSWNAGVMANALLANTPQLIATFIYLFCNDMLTRMLMNQEWSQFASTREPLRVSKPEGAQRSTYWLQLPYRYSVPLMASMMLLHWLISRSLFLVSIRGYNSNGQRQGSTDIGACGYSPLAILLGFCLLTVMVLTLIALGRFKHIDAGIPAASSCSVVISAAVHPPAGEPEDAALLPLQYGVIPDSSVPMPQLRYMGLEDMQFASQRQNVREHVSFSSSRVRPLQDGIVYC